MATQPITGDWELDARPQREALSSEEVLHRVRHLAQLLDNRFTIPGTSYRFGLDSLIGLIPGIGDLATGAISAYIVYLARTQGVPKHVLARMAWNIAVDTGIGAIPLLGDVMDFAWKANLKNVKLLERHLHKASTRERAGQQVQ